MERFKYEQYAQTYSTSQKRFIPKDVKVRLFWEQYPNGCIEVSPPKKDPEMGVICICNIYKYAHDKEHTLMASSFARKAKTSAHDTNEDIVDHYMAVKEIAISDALSLAGIDLPLEIMYSNIILNKGQEEVIEEGTKKRDISEVVSKERFVEEPISCTKEPFQLWKKLKNILNSSKKELTSLK